MNFLKKTTPGEPEISKNTLGKIKKKNFLIHLLGHSPNICQFFEEKLIISFLKSLFPIGRNISLPLFSVRRKHLQFF